MSRRVLLIGRGPLPSAEAPQLGFSQLRTRTFHRALREAGHAVTLALLVPEGHSPDARDDVVIIHEEGPGWLEQVGALAEKAEVIVGAGPYNPSRAACLVAQDQPVWADIPGEPFAELQALALARPGGLDKAAIAAAQSGAIAVLARADAISTISGPQRFATLGQLGLLGRLLETDTTPSVNVLPISADFDLPGAPPRPRSPDEPLVIALCGAFNPWFDADTLITSLDLALAHTERLRVVCTGGGIEGFYEDGYARFRTWAAGHTDQVTLHGWVPHGELVDVLHNAHVGLSLDRPGVEPELGSRTRLLLFAHMGLLSISTVRCELTRQWADADALVGVPSGDPQGVADALVAAADRPAPIERIERARTLTQDEACPDRITRPLIEWVASPRRTRPTAGPEATLAVELDRRRAELSRIHGSPTWQMLDRVRALSRLGRRPSGESPD